MTGSVILVLNLAIRTTRTALDQRPWCVGAGASVSRRPSVAKERRASTHPVCGIVNMTEFLGTTLSPPICGGFNVAK